MLREPSNAPRDFDSDRPLDWHIDILAAGTYLGRRSLLQNSVNRHMTQSICAMFGCAVIFRFVAWMMAMGLLAWRLWPRDDEAG